MHPFKKHLCLRNQWTAYAADMNVLLSYYNLLDDWEDEEKTGSSYTCISIKKRRKTFKGKISAAGESNRNLSAKAESM